jgi:hypothetical protein
MQEMRTEIREKYVKRMRRANEARNSRERD